MDNRYWQGQKMMSKLQPVCSIDERPTERKRPRFVPFLLTFCIMALVWVIFSGLFDSFHLTLGVISCALVAYFSSDLLFGDDFSLSNFLTSSGRFLLYVPWLLKEIMVANFWLMYLVFHPRMKELIDPQIFRFQTGLTGTMSRLTLANSITLTPGTVTVYVSVEGEVTVHAIDGKSAASLPGTMESIIGKTFGER